MELYRKVRLACRDGMSERAAARHFGVSRESVRKMLEFSVPPGYRRTAPVRRPKLDGFTGLIDEWLRRDRKEDHRKQRHTAKRIFERLRDEHGFTGGYTIVKDHVRENHRRRREMYVPLVHPPGHAQADFGEAWAFIGGVKQKVHFFAFDLPHSDASYVRAYPAATAEAWVDGHVHAFSFFGTVPLSILYDNERCLVSRIERDGTRRRTRLFSGFLSHYLTILSICRTRAAFTAGIERANEGIAGLERALTSPPESGSGSAIEVHAEADRVARLDLVRYLRFYDSRSPGRKLDLLDFGLKDAIAQPPFQQDELRPGSGLRSMGPPEICGNRLFREYGRPRITRNVLGKRLHRG